MVRIKFTGPPGPNAAMQMQAAPGLKTLASKPPTSVQNKSQNEVGERAHPAAQQTMLSKQQQSLEMVQIMLHVSVSLLFARNIFMMTTDSMLPVRHLVLPPVRRLFPTPALPGLISL